MYSPWVLSTTSTAAAGPMVTRISSGTDSAVHARAGGVLVGGRCDVMWDSSLDHVPGGACSLPRHRTFSHPRVPATQKAVMSTGNVASISAGSVGSGPRAPEPDPTITSP